MQAIASFNETPRQLKPNTMETDTTEPMTMLDLSTLIQELKHDIATIILETCAMFQQQATLKSTMNHKSSSAT